MRCIAELCGVAFEKRGLECQEAPLRRWVLLLLFLLSGSHLDRKYFLFLHLKVQGSRLSNFHWVNWNPSILSKSGEWPRASLVLTTQDRFRLLGSSKSKFKMVRPYMQREVGFSGLFHICLLISSFLSVLHPLSWKIKVGRSSMQILLMSLSLQSINELIQFQSCACLRTKCWIVNGEWGENSLCSPGAAGPEGEVPVKQVATYISGWSVLQIENLGSMVDNHSGDEWALKVSLREKPFSWGLKDE